jgi:hypothetical protein
MHSTLGAELDLYSIDVQQTSSHLPNLYWVSTVLGSYDTVNRDQFYLDTWYATPGALS